MRRRWHRCVLLLTTVAPCACDRTDLGVPGAPDGPMRILRVTLMTGDDGQREAPVFTDLAAPLRCGAAEVCGDPVQRDRYGARLSPPTPDSAHQIRVVLDRVPVYAGARELETPVYPPLPTGGMDTGLPPTGVVLNVPGVVALTSPDGCAAPPLTASVWNSGTGQTPDVFSIPYGPALQLALAPDGQDPLAALEPGCRYQVQVDAGLSGYDRRPVDLAGAALAFTVEAPRVLRAGIGDDEGDRWYAAAPGPADEDTAQVAPPTQFAVSGLASNGALRLQANAPLAADTVEALQVTASVDGVAVAAAATLARVGRDPQTMMPRCDVGDGRSIFIFPKAGSWGAGAQLTVTLDGAQIRAVTQAAQHPAGTHSLGAALRVQAALAGGPAGMDYAGVLAAQVAQRGDPACGP